MKKTTLATLGMLVGLGVALAIIPTTRDEFHWFWASQKDEAASYASYVAAWPQGRHGAEAWARYDEHAWTDAESSKTVEGFELYAQLHAEGKHVTEAQNKIDSLHWQGAATGNTIRSYRDYIAAHPQGIFLEQAEAKAFAFRTDRTPYDTALQAGTEAALREFLSEFPGHEKEKQADQVLREITEGRDIVSLLNENKIEIETQGSGIKNVKVRIRRLVPYPITVTVPVGSYFVSARQSAQNMITSAEENIHLSTDDWRNISIDAACANRPRDIPGSEDSFTVQRSPHQAELARLMPVLDKAQASYPVRQAAVWIVTDNADYGDLGILVSRSVWQIYGGTRQIQEPETARAMKICADAGIDIRRKAIWRDRERILRGLETGKLKSWLEQSK